MNNTVNNITQFITLRLLSMKAFWSDKSNVTRFIRLCICQLKAFCFLVFFSFTAECINMSSWHFPILWIPWGVAALIALVCIGLDVGCISAGTRIRDVIADLRRQPQRMEERNIVALSWGAMMAIFMALLLWGFNHYWSLTKQLVSVFC